MLRLGNSMDAITEVPDEGRVYRLVERYFEEVTGEPCETTYRQIAPRDTMPAIMDRWVREHRPDVALIILSQYWYGFASAPKKVEETFGAAGRRLGLIGYRLAMTPWLANNSVFRGLRRLARRTIGVEYHFEPEAVVEVMKACMTTIQERHPEVAIALWSEPIDVMHLDDERQLNTLRARRRRVHDPLRAFCQERGIPHYLVMDPEVPYDWKEMREPDGIHLNREGHIWVAHRQLPVVLAAWEQRKKVRAGALRFEARG